MGDALCALGLARPLHCRKAAGDRASGQRAVLSIRSRCRKCARCRAHGLRRERTRLAHDSCQGFCPKRWSGRRRSGADLVRRFGAGVAGECSSGTGSGGQVRHRRERHRLSACASLCLHRRAYPQPDAVRLARARDEGVRVVVAGRTRPRRGSARESRLRHRRDRQLRCARRAADRSFARADRRSAGAFSYRNR